MGHTRRVTPDGSHQTGHTGTGHTGRVTPTGHNRIDVPTPIHASRHWSSRPPFDPPLTHSVTLARLPPLLPRLDAATPPLTCPAGAPIGSFQLSISPPGEDAPLIIQAANQLLPGYRIFYVPGTINSPDKKKARIASVLALADHGKIWCSIRSRPLTRVFGMCRFERRS